MKLKAYLERTGESANSFAKRSKVPRTTVMRIWHEDDDLPKLRIAKAIVHATHGQVSYEDLAKDRRRWPKRSSAA